MERGEANKATLSGRQWDVLCDCIEYCGSRCQQGVDINFELRHFPFDLSLSMPLGTHRNYIIEEMQLKTEEECKHFNVCTVAAPQMGPGDRCPTTENLPLRRPPPSQPQNVKFSFNKTNVLMLVLDTPNSISGPVMVPSLSKSWSHHCLCSVMERACPRCAKESITPDTKCFL